MRFIASGFSMDVVASVLRIPSGRPVIDETGLSGRWDIASRFTPLSQTPDELPSVFTAVREPLGLTLEPAIRPMDVLIIEGRAEAVAQLRTSVGRHAVWRGRMGNTRQRP